MNGDIGNLQALPCMHELRRSIADSVKICGFTFVVDLREAHTCAGPLPPTLSAAASTVRIISTTYGRSCTGQTPRSQATWSEQRTSTQSSKGFLRPEVPMLSLNGSEGIVAIVPNRKRAAEHRRPGLEQVPREA